MPILNIAIDGNEANITNRVGSNTYAFELLNELEKITRDKQQKITFTILLSSSKQAHMPSARIGWIYRIITPRPFWTQWALPIHLFFNKKRYHLLFTPGHYAPRISSIPYICSVMDLAFLRYKNLFEKKDLLQLTAWTKYSVKNAHKVVTISEFSKKEINQLYKYPYEKIEVIYPSSELDENYSKQEFYEFLEKKKIKRPYILYLGTIQPRKNLTTLIDAFNLHAASYPKDEFQLVLAGKTGWLADEIIQSIRQSPYKERIITTGFIPDKYKYPLYRKAVCSVLIGLYEGFGIPALESLQADTIPVVANNTSLPEVVGQAGILVNPQSADAVADGFATVWEMTKKQKGQLHKIGREQAARFSYKNSAHQLLHLLISSCQEIYG